MSITPSCHKAMQVISLENKVLHSENQLDDVNHYERIDMIIASVPSLAQDNSNENSTEV